MKSVWLREMVSVMVLAAVLVAIALVKIIVKTVFLK